MDEMDRKLLDLYLSFGGPEVGPWNRSPRSLYIEYWTRQFLINHLEPWKGIRVCNVGVGVGSWDDFLCDFLAGTGRLTSVDIDREICDLFEYRQQREGHRDPADVICADILRDLLPARTFDVVTMIGSTATETGDYVGSLKACWRLVATRGHMMFMDFARSPIVRVKNWIASVDCESVDQEIDGVAQANAFWIKRL